MMGGATAVVTLLRPEDRDREVKTEDQQFHVLPLYVPDCSQEDLNDNVSKGGLVCLDKFKRTIAIRETKKANCKRGRINAERKRMLDDIAKGNMAPIPQFDGAAGEEDSASDSSLNLSTSFTSDTSFDSSAVRRFRAPIVIPFYTKIVLRSCFYLSQKVFTSNVLLNFVLLSAARLCTWRLEDQNPRD